MASCYNMKEGEVYICDICGLEVRVEKGCTCNEGEDDACSVPMQCCGQPMRRK